MELPIGLITPFAEDANKDDDDQGGDEWYQNDNLAPRTKIPEITERQLSLAPVSMVSEGRLDVRVQFSLPLDRGIGVGRVVASDCDHLRLLESE